MIWKSRFDLWYGSMKKPKREIMWVLTEAADSESAIKAGQTFAEHHARMDVKLLSVEHRQTGTVQFPCKLPVATI